jgi:hypothetical protein
MARLVRPVVIGDAVLDSSDAVDEAQWNSGSTYALGDVRSGPAPYDKLIYESAQAGNLSHPVTDDAWWIEVGRRTSGRCSISRRRA